jgi:hypothetical protein
MRACWPGSCAGPPTPTRPQRSLQYRQRRLFRWSWLWRRLAAWFGVQAAGFSGEMQPLEAASWQTTRRCGARWRRAKLAEPDLDRLASPWHTDLDLGRPIEVMTDMANSRRLGFAAWQATEESFFDLFSELRAKGLIP